MAHANPMARKHPWLMALGILAGTAVVVTVVAAVLLFIAFANFMGNF